MEKNEIQERFLIIVCEQFFKNPDEVNLSDGFKDKFGADSLDFVEMILECEDIFDISIPDADAETIKTIEDAVDYLDKRINKNPEA